MPRSCDCQVEQGADPLFANNVCQTPMDLAYNAKDSRSIVYALKNAPKARQILTPTVVASVWWCVLTFHACR